MTMAKKKALSISPSSKSLLPKLDPVMPPMIVLDVDHTLVHTAPAAHPSMPSFPVGMENGKTFHCHPRPYCFFFLRYLCQRVQRGEAILAIWSAGVREYVEFVVAELFSMANLGKASAHGVTIYAREQTHVATNGDCVKVLDTLCHPRIILIDDGIAHAMVPSNAGKVWLIPPFVVDTCLHDCVLTWIMYALDYRFQWMRMHVS